MAALSLAVSSSLSASSCCLRSVFCSSNERRSSSNCCSSSCQGSQDTDICQARENTPKPIINTLSQISCVSKILTRTFSFTMKSWTLNSLGYGLLKIILHKFLHSDWQNEVEETDGFLLIIHLRNITDSCFKHNSSRGHTLLFLWGCFKYLTHFNTYFVLK